MDVLFWFVFGAVTGVAAAPHLQRAVARVRRELAELDRVEPPRS